MRTARITTENGVSWSTSVNGTDEEIVTYFLGKWFDVGQFPTEEMSKVVEVVIDGNAVYK